MNITLHFLYVKNLIINFFSLIFKNIISLQMLFSLLQLFTMFHNFESHSSIYTQKYLRCWVQHFFLDISIFSIQNLWWHQVQHELFKTLGMFGLSSDSHKSNGDKSNKHLQQNYGIITQHPLWIPMALTKLRVMATIIKDYLSNSKSQTKMNRFFHLKWVK